MKPNFKKICIFVLQLAARQEWDSLTLAQMAKAAKTPLAALQKEFADVNDLLPLLVEFIDDEVAVNIGAPLASGSAHDRLFEVMMARFDVLQKHRQAILGIMASAKRNPALLQKLLPAQQRAMQKMLSLSGIAYDDMKQKLAVYGLIAIYGLVLYNWKKDMSRDMSPTMAILDRHLRRSGKIADFLFTSL